jgi:hypothetical protein
MQALHAALLPATGSSDAALPQLIIDEVDACCRVLDLLSEGKVAEAEQAGSDLDRYAAEYGAIWQTRLEAVLDDSSDDDDDEDEEDGND